MSPARGDAWRSVVASAEQKSCAEYARLLKQAVASATPEDAQQLQLLATVTSMGLRLGQRMAPLRPATIIGSSRTAVPSDLSEDEVDDLAQLLPRVDDSELAARLCDLLWTRKRTPAYAKQAIDEYVAAAKRLEADPVAWRVRVERAFAFAATIKDRDGAMRVVAVLKEKLADERPILLNRLALELLLMFDSSDPQDWAAHSERCAKAAADIGNVLLERNFHACAAAWHLKTKDAAAVRRCRIAEAETYVKEAERASDADSALLMKAHFYQQAIEAFRRVGNCRERIDQLHRQYLTVQAKATSTMSSFAGPSTDISESVNAVTKALEGLSLPEALLRLATFVRLPSREQVRQTVETSAAEHPFSYMLGRQKVDSKGRTISKSAGYDPTASSIENESALFALMCEHVETLRSIYVAAIIEPARRKIWLDHGFTEADLDPLVLANPIVPAGRERLFARALRAGMSGDFIEAAHLAIPQIEHAVRTLLNMRGVITTSLADDGVQSENSLGTLLEKPELAQILGEDRVFDMRSLLTEQDGANLRNRASHGLMDYEDFNSASVVYLWWLLLHLCFLPTLVAMQKSDDSNSGIDEGS